ncbi:CRISPR-associated endonuclease Cas3'' [Desulfococcus sp.]|uniref:CRISPR-associated endonuclease Cas3'' n=1 Tax=Desulfococcus sp. TaxID=2025834 RepID=UPI00359443B3
MNLFWGKLKQDKETGEVLDTLALSDHSLDVAMVFRRLCEMPAILRTLNHAAGVNLASRQLDRLGVFAFVHDLGKCNWGFQAKEDPKARITAGHTRETLPLFVDSSLASEFYRIFECERLIRWVDGPESVFRLFLAALSHHGRPAFTVDDTVSLSSDKTAASLPTPACSLVTMPRKKFFPRKGRANIAAIKERTLYPWRFRTPHWCSNVPIRKWSKKS